MKNWLYIIVLLLGIPVNAQQIRHDSSSDNAGQEYIRIAEEYIGKGKIDKAIKQLDKGIKTAPVTYAYWLRGSNLYKQDKWEKSIEDLDIVVKDSVGVTAEIYASAKTMLVDAKDKSAAQQNKRIGRLGIYGTSFMVTKGVVKSSKTLKNSIKGQKREKTTEKDTTSVVPEDKAIE